jgi:hypothetical protein
MYNNVHIDHRLELPQCHVRNERKEVTDIHSYHIDGLGGERRGWRESKAAGGSVVGVLPGAWEKLRVQRELHKCPATCAVPPLRVCLSYPPPPRAQFPRCAFAFPTLHVAQFSGENALFSDTRRATKTPTPPASTFSFAHSTMATTTLITKRTATTAALGSPGYELPGKRNTAPTEVFFKALAMEMCLPVIDEIDAMWEPFDSLEAAVEDRSTADSVGKLLDPLKPDFPRWIECAALARLCDEATSPPPSLVLRERELHKACRGPLFDDFYEGWGEIAGSQSHRDAWDSIGGPVVENTDHYIVDTAAAMMKFCIAPGVISLTEQLDATAECLRTDITDELEEARVAAEEEEEDEEEEDE